MPRDFFPSREAEIGPWSLNFSTLLTANFASYGCTTGQASTYAGYHAAWIDKYTLAQDPSTRTTSAILAKNQAKVDLAANARLLARIIQAHPGILPSQLSDLGLTVRDTHPAPIPSPTEEIDMDIVSVVNRTVKCRVHGADATSRAKPAGVASIMVWSYVGATQPVELADWHTEGVVTKTTFEIVFPSDLAPGSTVFMCAAWMNRKGETGTACTPRSVTFGAANATGT
jgi:hypothetical protein